MNPEEKEILETGLTVVLKPVTDLAETVLGLAGGDLLSEVRKRNRARMAAKTKKVLEERGVEPDEVAPVDMIPLLAAAQDESRDELLEIYARLLAAAADPARRGGARRQFIEIAREMEPIDVAVLEKTRDAGDTRVNPTRFAFFAEQLQVPADNVLNAMAALKHLGLLENETNLNAQLFPRLSPLGRQFLAAIDG
jgi:hypothetical protein